MKEIYNRSFIAIPIKESPLLNFVNVLNNQKQFVHMTLYFLDSLDEDQLLKVRSILQEAPNHLKSFSLEPDKTEMLGLHAKTHVLKLKENDDLFEFRIYLEDSLPNYKDLNLPFVPHITIRSYGKARVPDNLKLGRAPLKPYTATSVGVYYKTDEGATALLYSKKYENTGD